jgi:type VI secretion system protein ImpC
MTQALRSTTLEAEDGLLSQEANNDFDRLLKKEFRPTTAGAEHAVKEAVLQLSELALNQTQLISDDSVRTIEAMIGELDRQLSAQLNEIIHNEEFQQLESSWRGLRYLVDNSDTDEMLKIKMLDVSKVELRESFNRNIWNKTPLFKMVYEEEYDQLGGHPFACLLGDYYFDHTPMDCNLLRSLSELAYAAHSPFITGTSPTVMGLNSWQELASKKQDLGVMFQNKEYTQWRGLRDSEKSNFLGLTVLRFLGRLPYGLATNPVMEFAFEEDMGTSTHERYTWINSMYAMGVNINRSFSNHGWATMIRGVESGGLVSNLHCHTFPSDDGGMELKCPTEIAISNNREGEFAKNGFIPLQHRKNTDLAVFIGAQSLQKPKEFVDPNATANARLSARLPYMFAVCRFSHYLRCIVRDKIGTFKSRDDMQRWLNGWVSQYVLGNPENAGDAAKAQRPLAAAEVVVTENEKDPGYYSAKISLRPHYQLEGLTTSISLVAKLPSEIQNTK